MNTTVKDLKALCAKLPDDAQVWIEYPEPLAEPVVMEKSMKVPISPPLSKACRARWIASEIG